MRWRIFRWGIRTLTESTSAFRCHWNCTWNKELDRSLSIIQQTVLLNMLLHPESKLFLASGGNQADLFLFSNNSNVIEGGWKRVCCVPQKVPLPLITGLNAVHQCAFHAGQHRCTAAPLTNINPSYRIWTGFKL